jgi:hypothetical protein
MEMNTQTHSTESDDSVCMAYGREVQALLSMSSAATWADDLWTMYTGFMVAQKQMGYNPEISDTFYAFRELVFFFGRLQKGKCMID